MMKGSMEYFPAKLFVAVFVSAYLSCFTAADASPNAKQHEQRPSLSLTPKDGTTALKVDEQFFVGKVIDVTALHVNDQLLQATGMTTRQQLVTVEIEEGPLKGLQAKVLNEITD